MRRLAPRPTSPYRVSRPCRRPCCDPHRHGIERHDLADIARDRRADRRRVFLTEVVRAWTDTIAETQSARCPGGRRRIFRRAESCGCSSCDTRRLPRVHPSSSGTRNQSSPPRRGRAGCSPDRRSRRAAVRRRSDASAKFALCSGSGSVVGRLIRSRSGSIGRSTASSSSSVRVLEHAGALGAVTAGDRFEDRRARERGRARRRHR